MFLMGSGTDMKLGSAAVREMSPRSSPELTAVSSRGGETRRERAAEIEPNMKPAIDRLYLPMYAPSANEVYETRVLISRKY